MTETVNQDLDEFLAPMLQNFAENIAKTLSNAEEYIAILDPTAIIESTTSLYSEELKHLSFRLPLCFRVCGTSTLATPGPSAKRSTHANSAEEHKPYAEWSRLVNVMDRRLNRLVETAIRRLYRDKRQIQCAGIPIGDTLTSLIVTRSDPHNGGQRVCLISTEQAPVVYKPRPLEIDRLVQDLAGALNHSLPLSARIKIPTSVPLDGYGWQEFIPMQPVESPQELAAYYESLGSLCAFFAALHGLDLHYENLTVSGGRAVPIDLETALGTNRNQLALSKESGTRAALDQAAFSAGAGTLILPPLIRTERFDIDLSPITDGSSQTSKSLSLAHDASANTDASNHPDQASLIKPTPHGGQLDDTIGHPQRYVAHFTMGFHACRVALRKNSDAIKLTFETRGAPPNRCILRPTSTYSAFLDTSFHPDYLIDREKRRQLFKRLRPTPGLPPELAAITLDAEISSLMEGDIPYFSDRLLRAMALPLDADAREAASEYGIAHYEPARGYDAAPEVIRYVQHGAFATMDSNVWLQGDDREIAPFFDINSGQTWTDACTALTRAVKKLTLWGMPKKREATMFMHSVGPDKRIRVTGIDNSFYDGQGPVWLLADWLLARQDAGAEEILRGLLKTQLSAASIPEQIHLSGFIGPFSSLRLLPLAEKFLNSEYAAEYAERIFSRTELGTPISHRQNLDYVTGYAGALEILCQPPLDEIPEARRLREEIFSRTLAGFPDLATSSTTGIAHGPLGVANTLIQASRYLDIDEPQHLVDYVFQRTAEELHSNPRSGGSEYSWCSGKSGVLQAFAATLSATGLISACDRHVFHDQLETFLDDCSTLSGPVDFSLCHGISGSVSAWSTIAVALGDESIVERLNVLSKSTRRRVTDGEILIRGGVRHASSSLGYMLGMSGAILAMKRAESTI